MFRFSIPVILFLLAAVFFHSCDKDREHPVPHVHVNIDLNIINYNLNSPGLSHQFAQNEGGRIFGYRGIIVYRLSTDEFRAFDRACPCNPHQCTVSIDPENRVTATDACCGSRFLLIDGSVMEGDAGFPLKPYRTFFNPSTNRLQITN